MNVRPEAGRLVPRGFNVLILRVKISIARSASPQGNGDSLAPGHLRCGRARALLELALGSLIVGLLRATLKLA